MSKRIESKTGLRDVIDIPNKEYVKHILRVKNIIRRANDVEHEESLAMNMANKIITIDKAYGRYLVSLELEQPHLAKTFLDRFKTLTYSLQDWRKEKIESFLEELEEDD